MLFCDHSKRHGRRDRRKGTVVVLAAFLMVFILGLLAFAIDVGYMSLARTELQRSADAAAMAAAWRLIDEQALQSDTYMTNAMSNCRSSAEDIASLNVVCNDAPAIDTNGDNSIEGDVVIGYLSSLTDQSLSLDTSDSSKFNAVQVCVRRNEDLNGRVAFFFGQILGVNSATSQATATAALVRQIGGFQIPSDGGNLGILPIALDEDSWNDLLDGSASDTWTWDADTQSISGGSDGVREINLYPEGTGSPGNRGTVDIGSSNNSTNDISRQIVYGVSAEDMEYHDGKLEFDENGVLLLNGDTGISAGIKDELASIKGEPRVIPVFRNVAGPGNNAEYTIVKWVGVRILDVKLTGSNNSKRVTVQPANILMDGVIPTTVEGTSDFVYTRPVLVR